MPFLKWKSNDFDNLSLALWILSLIVILYLILIGSKDCKLALSLVSQFNQLVPTEYPPLNWLKQFFV